MISDTIDKVNMFSANSIPFLLLVDFEMVNSIVFPLSELPEDILFQTTGYSRNGVSPIDPGSYEFSKTPIDYNIYLNSFRIVRDNTLAGNTYLTNLTFPTEIHTDLSLATVYNSSQAKYKLLYRDEFVVFSPEIINKCMLLLLQTLVGLRSEQPVISACHLRLIVEALHHILH